MTSKGLKRLESATSGCMSVREHEVSTGERKSNAEFAKEDKAFKKACAASDTEPTARQASKYRNKRGLAFWVTH